MDPLWIYWEQALRQFRKKTTDFSNWTKKVKVKFPDGTKEVLPEEAFLKIRSMLAKDLVLRHLDYAAAANPAASGRPLEIFIDASDYGWCATLCQRETPQGAPKIVSIIAKAFDDTQLRWSAMERELYALWQGVVGHERYLKGFKAFCYIDHKNNIFSEAQLDNRRRSKKMSNWALELQQFDIVRVWIRGEANILGDAPSRAPWENALARLMPIPDGPVRQVINAMYNDPDSLELLVSERAKTMDPDGSLRSEFEAEHGKWKDFSTRSEDVLSPPIKAEPRRSGDGQRANQQDEDLPTLPFNPYQDVVLEQGYETPQFGARTPTFVEADRVIPELGCGQILHGDVCGVYPKHAAFVSNEAEVVRCCAGLVGDAPEPPSEAAEEEVWVHCLFLFVGSFCF